jgi:hypothetical protein
MRLSLLVVDVVEVVRDVVLVEVLVADVEVLVDVVPIRARSDETEGKMCPYLTGRRRACPRCRRS